MAANAKVPSATKDCYICEESYENPKLLPCLHAFCRGCLESVAMKTHKNAGDTMECPICRRSYSIPAEGIDGLPTDFFLSRLAELSKAGCVTGAETLPSVLEARDCDVHSKAKLTFYCTHCDRVLCDSCFEENHQNHMLQSAKKAAAKFCDDFQDCRFSGGKAEMLGRLEEFKRGKLELGGIAESLRDRVRVRKESIEQLLDKHTQSMFRDIDSEESRLVAEYERMSKDHELHLACLESFEGYWREITTRGSPDDVCCAMTSINRRSDELVKMHGSLVKRKSPQYSLEFKESDLEEFFSNDGWNIIGSIPVNGRRKPTKENRKEQIIRLNGRIRDLKDELKQKNMENQDLQTEVEILRRDLKHLQSSIEAEQGPVAELNEREERLEIESLQRRLEQMTDAQQSIEWQMNQERTSHQEMNDHLNRRIEELDAETLRNHFEIHQQSTELSVLRGLLSGHGNNQRERPKYEIDQEFSGQILNAKSQTIDIRVTGLAILRDEQLLFMATCNSEVLLVRDLTNIKTLRGRVKIDGLDDPYDMCSCPKNHCLYIFDKTSRKIFSVDKTGSTSCTWETGDDVGTLSVADDSNVILILHQDNKLKEYYPYGGFMREIELFKYGIDSPWHAMKLSSRYYVISHGDYQQRLQRVCMADVIEEATIRSFGEDLDWPMRREITPFYLTRDAAGYVMVADRKSNSVLLLKPSLEFDKVVVENGDASPDADLLAERFCLDEAKSLIVASNFKANGLWACSVRSHKFN